MNSVTKIGKMVLAKYLGGKPMSINDQTYVRKVIFEKDALEISLLTVNDFLEDKFGHYETLRIWSIELGIIHVNLKPKQTVYDAVLKKLKKLQCEDVPSHLIVNKSLKLSNTTITTSIVYRMSDEQESEMFNVGLVSSIEKRDKARQERWEKEHQQFEKEYEEYLSEAALCDACERSFVSVFDSSKKS